jgi:hypothetical protein
MNRFLILGMLVLCPATAHADVLPKALLGLWAFEPADCSNPRSDGLLKIEANAARFFASSHDISRIVRKPNGSLRASGLVSDEGEEGRRPGSLTLKLMSRDRLYVLDHIYYRCSIQ